MKILDPIFISFKPNNETFIGFISFDVAVIENIDSENIIKNSVELYSKSIKKIKKIIHKVENAKNKNIPIKACIIWDLGNEIFYLISSFKKNNLAIDGLYDHLSRDLGKTKKWFSDVITFRRYIEDKTVIPKSLSWGSISNSPKQHALNFVKDKQ